MALFFGDQRRRSAKCSAKTGMNDQPEIPFTAGLPLEIGKRAEPRVLQIVDELLAASSHSVVQLPARDARGEDGCLSVDGRRYTVQITNVPHAPDFWATVAQQGSATTQANLERMAGWLEEATLAKIGKMEPAERKNTIVALDVHDWAAELVAEHVITSLESSVLNPARCANLGGIAIAGRTLSSSTYLPGLLQLL